MDQYVLRGESFEMDKVRYFYGNATMQPVIDPRTGMPKYRRVLVVYKIPLFEFTQNAEDPLTYVAHNGLTCRPQPHLTTDGGTIPRFLWAVPFIRLGPWDFPRAYPFHDSGFTYGGLYVKEADGFRFKLLSRNRLNVLLGEMIRSDGGSSVDEGTVEFGLKLGSWSTWDPDQQKRNRERDGVVVQGMLL